MQKPLYTIEIKCANECSYATFPKFFGFHINFLWILSVFAYEPIRMKNGMRNSHCAFDLTVMKHFDERSLRLQNIPR